MKVKSAMTAASVAVILLCLFKFSGIERESSRINTIQVIEDFSKNEKLSAEEARAGIKRIAKREKLSVSQVEAMVAESVQRIRDLNRAAAGGLKPGVHIVSVVGAPALSATKIKVVPIGGVIDIDRNFSAEKVFRGPDNLANDEDSYIVPLSVVGTNLESAKFAGYYYDGKYLRGDAYAETDRLRSLERTPSGRRGWSGITRVFSDYPEIGRVIFREADNVAAGIVVRVPQNSINTSVGSYPATLIRLQDASGKSMSAVQWYGPDGRTSSLHIRQTDDHSVAAMMHLANDIVTEMN
ncbi:hypothetical protein QE385_002751 [Sphingomonas sp. SORGH_AS 950]|uniref:hypothetical protein n=1 Tax=Sphingomonas sp. SORGH_AS_0950 TaxID=3041792 RepID=UPI0027813D5E|nr:hypothetical protein [Sphingomonas sp. SORGH_AS_0950]MDQ1158424.1 hypothetical protein [Sphingomonas sp. SORGH_AS_0950]